MGENRSRPVDVRIIAATNRRLEREVNHGRFREDLFFRLSVVVVRIPPLRERLEDIELIAAALLRSLGRADHPIDTKLREELRAHEWPGNVRELRNYLERTVVLGANADQPWVASDGAAPGHVLATVDIDVPLKLAKEQLVARFERQYVRMLLEWAQGNVSRAARKAGMDRINMHRILQRHGLRAARSGSDS